MPSETRKIFTEGAWRDAGIFRREAMKPGSYRFPDPLSRRTPPDHRRRAGWQAETTAKNHVPMRRTAKKTRQAALGTKADPVLLEVFNNLFMSIAEQMGVTLQNTAYSVNIKERLDFSCAVFDRTGAWSPMRRTCRCIWAPWIAPSKRSSGSTRANSSGRRVCAQRPYNGGTHLPDITVVTPVFEDEASLAPSTAFSGHCPRILFFVAPRPSCRYPARPRVHNAIGHDRRRGRRAVRQFPYGRARPIPRAELLQMLTDHLTGTQPGAEHRRPQSADRRQRKGRRRAAQDGRISAWSGRSLYGPCPGQRRRKRAPRAGAIAGRVDLRVSDRHRSGHQGLDRHRSATGARRPSISPGPRR